MTTTSVSICNEALSMIGAKTIQSFDDNTENARRCAAIYDSSRKALLRMHPWSFAKKRMQLAPVATHPSFGYSHAFPLPSDFVRVIDTGQVNYEIEGRYILANTNLINLVYVADNDNEQTWDSLFWGVHYIMFLFFTIKKIVKCNLCGGDPMCAKVCPSGAIQYVEGTTANIRKKKVLADKFKDLFAEVND